MESAFVLEVRKKTDGYIKDKLFLKYIIKAGIVSGWLLTNEQLANIQVDLF